MGQSLLCLMWENFLNSESVDAVGREPGTTHPGLLRFLFLPKAGNATSWMVLYMSSGYLPGSVTQEIALGWVSTLSASVSSSVNHQMPPKGFYHPQNMAPSVMSFNTIVHHFPPLSSHCVTPESQTMDTSRKLVFNNNANPAWCCRPVIQALRRWKQQD